MVNKVILIGNVGKDPETKEVNDTSVTKFTLATSESYKDKQGDRVTNTEWHNIVAWGGLSNVIEKYVKKGSKLYIEGKLSHRKYEDKDGQTKYFTEIIAKEMTMLGAKKESMEQKHEKDLQKSDSKKDEFSNVDDLPF